MSERATLFNAWSRGQLRKGLKTQTRRLKTKVQAGDLLHSGEPLFPEATGITYYKDDGAEVRNPDRSLVDWRWKVKTLTSMYTPKAYRRIWLRCLSVHGERLQSITVEDIKAEGIELPCKGNGDGTVSPLLRVGEGRRAYRPDSDPKTWTVEDYWRCEWARLWDSINKKTCPWASNPVVQVIRFEVLSLTGRLDDG